jgi:hypothetical protein
MNAEATSSLPVPDSPSRSTVALEGATRSSYRRTVCRAGLSPMMSPKARASRTSLGGGSAPAQSAAGGGTSSKARALARATAAWSANVRSHPNWSCWIGPRLNTARTPRTSPLKIRGLTGERPDVFGPNPVGSQNVRVCREVPVMNMGLPVPPMRPTFQICSGARRNSPVRRASPRRGPSPTGRHSPAGGGSSSDPGTPLASSSANRTGARFAQRRVHGEQDRPHALPCHPQCLLGAARVRAPAGHRWRSPLASLDRHVLRISARHHRGRARSLCSGL